MEIETSTTVGTVLRDYPELTDGFMELGLCGCGNDSTMMWTIQRLSQEKDMDLVALLEKLNNKIENV